MSESKLKTGKSFFFRPAICCVCVLLLSIMIPPALGATTYIYATFTDDTGPGMKLKIYTSTDGLNWTLFSDTGFPSSGTSPYLRDPSIMKWTDGKYYIVYTNPTTASCCNPEDHFSIAASSDLKTWTAVANAASGVSGSVHVWAPEWYIEGGVARVIAGIDTLNNDSDFKPYIYTAQNSTLTSWSGPIDMNIGSNHIDTFMVKSGNTYHVFTKDETPRYIVHATSASITGPWTWVGTGNWAGWGSGLEGPAVFQLDNGVFRMYMDPQSASSYRYADSSDLSAWSALSTLSNLFRHGTVLRDSSTVPVPTPTPASLLPGDTNNNGAVDIVDALLIAQYYVGLNPVGFVKENADVNCSGYIDIVDALLVAQRYVELIMSFPC